MNRRYLTFDANSKRWKDENGFLHVDSSHITKEQVVPYYGYEIPNYEELGLNPDKVYYAYRPAEELEKAVPTVNGLPILLEHSHESASNPQTDRRIGSMGTDAKFNAPYLDNSLIFTVQKAIALIEQNEMRELSLSYRYDPVFKAGEYKGQQYDLIMTNIRGNHLALVPQGRAGEDVTVADSATQKKEGINMADEEKKTNDEMEKPDAMHKIMELITALADKLDPESVQALTQALSELQNKVVDQKPEDNKAADTCKDEEKPEENPEPNTPSQGEQVKQEEKIDVEKIAQMASDSALKKAQELINAQNAVRPFVGDLNVDLAKDSAGKIYASALKAMGLGDMIKGQNDETLREMFFVATKASTSQKLASDSKPNNSNLAKMLENIKNV